MDINDFKDTFDPKEIEIINEYLSGKSIRKISDKYDGYGRTKIRNIIEKYRMTVPGEKEKIEKKLAKDKFHKKDEDVELVDLTEEQIAKAYEDIQNGTTLTQIAKSYGRTRDFIKKRILEYINDEEEEKVFLEILKSNRHTKKKEEFLKMSEDDKKKFVFEKLNKRRTVNNRKEYTETFLEKKYARLKTYLLETRNKDLPEEEKITETEFFTILYDTPTLLSSSLRNRIIPAIENLDKNSNIGMNNTNKIIKVDASILCSSIQRTNLQIRILKENNLLENFLSKPRNFRTSPELVYALIELYKEKRVNESSVFITKSKLEKMYGITPEELTRKYNIKEKYGNDPYFER